MKIIRKIRNAYDKLVPPEKERVLPESALEPGMTAKKRARRNYRPALAAVLSLCIIAVAVFGVMKITSRHNAVDGGFVNGDGVIGGSESGKSGKGDGVIGGRPAGESGTKYAVGMPEPTGADHMRLEDGAYEGAYGTDVAIEGYKDGDYNGQYIYKAGTLTAGEWRDIDSLADWLEKFQTEEWNEYARKRGLYAFNVFEVRVKNGGDAIYNAKAELYGSDGKTLIYTALTDVTGRACLVYPEKYAGQVGVIKCCGKELQVTSADNGKTFELEADAASAAVTELDLMLMVDTTGSMGDELEYLKAELRDVVSRIAANGDQLSIRVSVNFYRDEGDEYVVKYFDFRTDIDECLEQIRKQYSDGGGDYPEAVHTALENAVNGHAWRENAVKLCFLVLDAPPHEEYEIQGINSQITKTLTDAASLGVRVIPVASSGVDKDTECLLRSYAVMTGGTYIFLTDHSGVGGDHIEASVGEYNVEPLNECMIRVACEYCGLKYTAPERPVPVDEESAGAQ